MPYCIDTSGLLDGYKRYYPPDVFHGLWENVDDLIAAGELISPEEVLNDLRVGDDDVFAWANARAEMFVPLDEPIQIATAEVLAVYVDWIPADRSRNVADAFVVALARVRNCPVVSGEHWSNSPNPARVKIPNVCDGLGMRHMTFLEMVRELGWAFRR